MRSHAEPPLAARKRRCVLAGCGESARQRPAEIPIHYGIRSGRPDGSAVPRYVPAGPGGQPGHAGELTGHDRFDFTIGLMIDGLHGARPGA